MTLTKKEEKAYEFMVNDCERQFLTGECWTAEIASLLDITKKQATGVIGSLVKKGYLKVYEGEVNGDPITQYGFPKDN